MKLTYKRKLFLYFFVVFALFTLVIVIYQQYREREYKRFTIENKLDVFSEIAQKDVESPLLPKDIRITIFDNGAKVIYDNNVDSVGTLENHFNRKEIILAREQSYGSDIRKSESLGVPYLYYAKKTDSGYIRMALPYSAKTKDLLAPDKTFLSLSLSLFCIALFFLWLIARRFGYDMMRLKRDIIEKEEARVALKSELTSAVAHELRTPVSAIRGYAETLLDSHNMPEMTRKTFIERTHNASVRLSELLRDISLLTKIEEAKVMFNNENVDIKNLIDSIVEEFSLPMQTNSIKVYNNVPQDIVVFGCRTLLYTIFRNLIENTVKYAGKWIDLTIDLTEDSQEYYSFSVSDSGGGVNESDLERIFERFYRVDVGRTRDDGGSGLGLAIVRHAVQHHQGEIFAKNLSNGGLMISFTLKKEL